MKQRLALAKFFARGMALDQECQRLMAEARKEVEKAEEKAEAAQKKADKMYENMSEEAAERAFYEDKATAADRAQERADALSEKAEDAADLLNALEYFYEPFNEGMTALGESLKDADCGVEIAPEWIKLPSEPAEVKRFLMRVLQRVYEPQVGAYVLVMKLVAERYPEGARVSMAWDESRGCWVKSDKCGGEEWPVLGRKNYAWLRGKAGQEVIAALYQGTMEEYLFELPPAKKKGEKESQAEG
ncbi:MAG: hypothetical protein IJO38_06075 [Akkermansia sp.]|nr:hypothetical protein [Akkermansia sp.]